MSDWTFLANAAKKRLDRLDDKILRIANAAYTLPEDHKAATDLIYGKTNPRDALASISDNALAIIFSCALIGSDLAIVKIVAMATENPEAAQ